MPDLPQAHDPRQNRLVAALPTADSERLLAQLELVPMPLGHVIYESGSELRHAYFQITSSAYRSKTIPG